MSDPGTLLQPTEDNLRLAVEALRRGDLVVIPTDTVYGLASRPTPDAVARLFVAKGRPEHWPIPVLLSDAEVVPRVAAEWPAPAALLAAQFWPGALTIAVRARQEIPAEITAGTGTVGLRVPASDLARAIIARAGGWLAVTSANRSGEPPALTAAAAVELLRGHVAYAVDGGRLAAGVPSTVVSVMGEEIKAIREGVIPHDRLTEALDAHGGIYHWRD